MKTLTSIIRPRGLHWTSLRRIAARPALPAPDRPLSVFICLADHFEPDRGRPPRRVARQRVAQWVDRYPTTVGGLTDSRGRPPQHSFFYPLEDYDPHHIDQLAALRHAGLADVEVHLHHDHDTSDNLRHRLEDFKHTLYHRHGLLGTDGQGNITYGFIHGNWALDNSRPDGRWCGVNDELAVLRQTGCYADFTLPSAPSLAQTRTVNSIYYALDDQDRPKSHDRGIAASSRRPPPPDSLLLIQGPLALDWSRRRYRVLPGIENGELHATHPPTLHRLGLWLRAGVAVHGRPDWLFVKLHTHGAQEANAAMLLGAPMRAFHEQLAEYFGARPAWRFFYVTAREMADLVHQAEGGGKLPCWTGILHERTGSDTPTEAAQPGQSVSGSGLQRAINDGSIGRPALAEHNALRL